MFCMQRSNLIGQTFGRLRVNALSHVAVKTYWHCSCSCGGSVVAPVDHLRSGHTRSCGCLQKDLPNHTKHGCAKACGRTREYSIWKNMRDRCRNPRNKSYKNYGGRGICVAERWDSFANFLEDMGKCPAGLSLDRKNNSDGYSPDNCRWASAKQQSRNRRSVRVYNGLPLPEVCERLGVSSKRVAARIRGGWSIEEALYGKRR